MATQRRVNNPTYDGRYSTYWSYVNQDSSRSVSSCCGQAAVHSVYRTKTDRTYPSSVTGLVTVYPPDNFFGLLGTSPDRMKQMCRGLGMSGVSRQTLRALQRDVGAGTVIVCLDAGKLTPSVWGLHWVAVFGRSSAGYHVSNWQGCCIPESQFLDAWRAPLTFAAGMAERYIYN